MAARRIYYFNALGLSTGIGDPDGYRTYAYYGDSANPYRVTRSVEKDGRETTCTYDPYGNLTSLTNPRNVTTTLTYQYTASALGRLVAVQEGTRTPTTMAYDATTGLIDSILQAQPGTTDGSTVMTSFTHDALGNLTSVTTPGNTATPTMTTTYEYVTDGLFTQAAALGQPLRVTDPLGHATHYRYDARGNGIQVTDALGHTTTTTYNLADQPVVTTLPATGQSGTGQGRLEAEYLYPGGLLTQQRVYDEGNTPTPVRTVQFTYGHFGELLQRSGSDEPVAYQYDALHRPVALRDGNNNLTNYTYDLTGHLTQVQYPGGETVQFPSFDPAGRILTRVDGNNVTTQYLYADAEGLLTNISYPATPALNVTLNYDGAGRLAQLVDGTGMTSTTYDDCDLPLSTTTTYTGLPARTLSYQYHPDGSRAQMTSPVGAFTYQYDAGGRVLSLANPFGATTFWQYLDNDWVSQQFSSNSAMTAYTHNALGQLTRLQNFTLFGSQLLSDYTNLVHDGAGNLLSLNASIPAHVAYSGATTYAYDARDQLTGEATTRYTGYQYSFAYDSAGNPTTFKGNTRNYTSNNQLSGTGYVYDGNGNPTTYGGTLLSFDPENRLTAFGTTLTAGYRGDHLRAWKDTSGVEGGGRRYFLYDGALLLHEMNDAGTVIATNTWGVTGLVSRTDGRGTITYQHDPQGSVAHRLDASGSVLSHDLYDAYGNLVDGGDTADPYGYNGRWGYYTDLETGLQLCTFRYYDSANGRWLTKDPIGYAGGINLYGYCVSNPVDNSDSFGLEIDYAYQRWYMQWHPNPAYGIPLAFQGMGTHVAGASPGGYGGLDGMMDAVQPGGAHGFPGPTGRGIGRPQSRVNRACLDTNWSRFPRARPVGADIVQRKFPKSGLSDKERATDKPSWLGERPFVNESGKDFAKRVMDVRYPGQKYSTKSGEFSQIKKWADRYFENPPPKKRGRK